MLSVPFPETSENIVSISVVSSTIKTATALNKFLVIGDGIEVTDVLVQTDSTGLAGGTLFQVQQNGTYGNPIILSHAVSSLGANASIDLSTATTKFRAFIPGGNYITLQSTAADCTGAGVAVITIRYRRTNSNSSLMPL